jgi:hypothetical protein
MKSSNLALRLAVDLPVLARPRRTREPDMEIDHVAPRAPRRANTLRARAPRTIVIRDHGLHTFRVR